MTVTNVQPDSPTADDATLASAATLPCPRCGYDLRGTSSDRCSECGQTIDRNALAESGIPWAHRKKLGRVRTFLVTVRRFSYDSLSIRQELSKPQNPADARWFRFWVTLIVATAGWTALAVAMLDYPLETLLLQRDALWDKPSGTPMPGWQQDLLVPWFCGISFYWLTIVCIGLYALYLSGVTRSAIHFHTPDERARRSANAVGLYAAAPLVWLILPALLYLGSHFLGRASWFMRQPDADLISQLRTLLQIAAAALLVLIVGLSFRRSGQWISRVHHAGFGRSAWGVLECLVRVIVGFVVCRLIIPWCCGLIWIAIDSVR
jgi:hypothetical protein